MRSARIVSKILNMASAKDIYNVIQNGAAYGNGVFPRVDSEYKAYKQARCYHPISVKCFDSHLGQFVVRQVPCGCCYHCRETKQNEWVTRLYAHCEDFKYVYFITLTYRSFNDKNLGPFATYLLNYLAGAYWHLDSFNETNRLCYSPCVLYKPHYQNFMKRLRKNTGIKNITYLLCGEYGSRYSRPHFHAILFSNSPITENDIKKAWSLQLSINELGEVIPSRNGKHLTYCSFGRIDFHDLVENGTLTNKSLVVDGRNMSARKCFAYVAKYCTKGKFNDTRIKYYFDYLQNSVEDYEKKDNVTPESCYYDFRKDYRPFISVSRGIPIGSLWLNRHIKEVAEDRCPRPPLQVQGAFIVPSYFRRKASESVYSLRLLSKSGSIRKGSLPAIASSLASLVKVDVSHIFNEIIDTRNETPQHFYFHTLKELDENAVKLLNSDTCFVDLLTRSRFLLAVEFTENGNFLPLDTFVCEYRFKRGVGWQFIRTHSLHSWCLHYITSMPADFTSYLQQLKKYNDSQYYLNLVYEFYAEFDRLDDFFGMSETIEKDNDAFFKLKELPRYQQSNL